MQPTTFRAIRTKLGLSQAALASVLGYSSPMRISEFERATNPRAVPLHVAMLMEAFAAGYRTKDWPRSEQK